MAGQGFSARAQAQEGARNLTQIGPYKILSRLGEGAHAAVFLAKRPDEERLVALKLLTTRDGQDAQRLLREGQLIGRLDHPGLVRLLDHGQHREQGYLVMDYVPGPTLRQRQEREGRLPWREGAEIMREVIQTMAAAHQAGVIHRDLKPSNVILDARDSRAKVTDLGLARDLSEPSSLTKTGDIVGTPLYMAPEQLRGERVDARADVFGLGVMLYEALTGERPWEGKTLLQHYEKLETEQALPPSRRAGGVPAELDDPVMGALAFDPDQRPADAGQLALWLSAALARADAAPVRRTHTATWGLAGAGLGVGLLLGLGLGLGPLASSAPTATTSDGALEPEAEAELERELGEARQTARALREELAAIQEQLAASERERQSQQAAAAEAAAQVEAAAALQSAQPLPVILDGLIASLASVPGSDVVRARLLYNRGRYAESTELAKAGFQAFPLAARSQERALDLLLAYFRGLVALEAPREVTEELLARLIELAPKSPQAAYARIRLMGRDDLAADIADYERIAAVVPTKPYVWRAVAQNRYFYGLLHPGQTATEQALMAGAQAIRTDVSNPGGYLDRATFLLGLLALGEAPEGITDPVERDLALALALRRDGPTLAEAGRAQLALDRPARALSLLGEAELALRDRAASERTRAAVAAWAGVCRLQLGRADDEVVNALRHGAGFDPLEAALRLASAWGQPGPQLRQRLLAELERAARLQRDDFAERGPRVKALGEVTLGVVLALQEKNDDARERLYEAWRSDPIQTARTVQRAASVVPDEVSQVILGRLNERDRRALREAAQLEQLWRLN